MKNHFTRRIITMITTISVSLGAALWGAALPVEAFSTFSGSSPFSGVAYGTYYHNADKFGGNIILNGVDVSEYQNGSKSDWTRAKANGVDFVILRVRWTGYGSAGNRYDDAEFRTHYQKAKSAGLMVGVYVFSQACSDAEAAAEAREAIATLQKHGISASDLDLPVYMDYEFAGPSSSGRMYLAKNKGNLTKSKATSYAKTFCETVKSLGYTPGIYASTSFLNNTIDGATLGQSYDIWAAQYYNKCEFTGTYTKWQYSSAAKIGGIHNSSGNTMSTDVNYWYLSENRTSSSASDIASCSFEYDNAYGYTGKSVEPDITVKSGDTKLTRNTDYAISYFDNVNIGYGYAYIRGMGSYSGYKLIKFKIGDVMTNLGIGNMATEDGYKLGLTDEAAAIGYSLSDKNLNGVVEGTSVAELKSAFTLSDEYENCSLAVRDASSGASLEDGEVVTTGRLLDVVNADGDRVGSVKINVDATSSISFDGESFYYDGTVKKPTVSVKYGNLDLAAGISESNDYISISCDESTNPGEYTMSVEGSKWFHDSYEYTYTIVVKPTYVSSLTATKSGFDVSWKEISKANVTGYQLQFSRKADMSEATRYNKAGYSATSMSVVNAYRSQKYYVRVRSYKTIGNVNYYSAWSATKMVTTK